MVPRDMNYTSCLPKSGLVTIATSSGWTLQSFDRGCMSTFLDNAVSLGIPYICRTPDNTKLRWIAIWDFF